LGPEQREQRRGIDWSSSGKWKRRSSSSSKENTVDHIDQERSTDVLENSKKRGRNKPTRPQKAHNNAAEEDPAGRLTSRRSFLSGSAKLLGGGALGLGLVAAPAFAKDDKEDNEDKEQGGNSTNGGGGGVTDVEILNYALTLERLEYEFYRQHLRRFNEREIEGAAIFNGFGRKVRSQIYENLVRIRNHEKTHVETLIAVIKKLGGDPVPACEYDFGVNGVADFVATAQVLEDTGVMAYDGAIAYIDKPGLQTAGATIATVEARHAAYLRLLNGEVPFPKPFDEPKAPQAVCELVHKTFITECPFDLEGFCKTLPNKVITL
jgi:rubrerythrin